MQLMQARLTAGGEFEALGLVRLGKGTISLSASPPIVALMTIAGMLDSSTSAGFSKRVGQRWRAESVGCCRVTGESALGPALARCFTDVYLARRVAMLEVALDYAAGKLIWDGGTSETAFMEGTDESEWRLHYQTANRSVRKCRR
jgi:hypothetical protein